MAARIFGLPIAAVSLTDTDRQWFKSRVGVDHWEIPREKAPCAEVAESRDFVLIHDFQESDCYRDSLLGVSGIRFYAGAPLVTREGHGLGALCVLGMEPRDVTQEEVTALKDLAAMVMSQIELHHAFGRIDPSSGLPNRNQFLEDLEDMARDHAGERRHAVVVDLLSGDQLADVLRIAGPAALDELAAASSRSIRRLLGASKLYHVGATQYVYFREGADTQDVLTGAADIRAALAGGMKIVGGAFSVSPTLGVAPFELGQASAPHVLRMALSAGQDARDQGWVGVYSRSLDDAHRRRFSMIERLRAALTTGDGLYLAYQPRIDLRSGDCVAVEALLRWTDQELGSISPGEFIPIAEKTTLARNLTEWVVTSAVAQAATWRANGIEIAVSLNVSASNLTETDFAHRVIACLARAGLPPSAIEIELTESAVITNGDAGLDQLDQLAAAGLRIAIDDFGTGYSSLSYLERLPASVLKIDRSFIANVERDPRARTLMGTMITLAHDLGYRAVAEGVETNDVYRFLAEQGCDEAQGFLMSRPLEPGALIKWLSEKAPGNLATEPLRRAG